MSKQSNQRYRKEIEKKNIKTEGMESKSSDSATNRQDNSKMKQDFNSASGGTDR